MKYIWLILCFVSSINATSQTVFAKETILMGCDFKITVVADNQEKANKYINIATNEIKRIENLISSWDKNSQTSKININAGINPVKVDNELFSLIERSIAISKITKGAFDISFASIDKIWKFDKSTIEMPNKELIKNSVAKIGFENIILDKENSTVFLKLKGMKIGFGAIGKGYAADKAKELLIKKGVKAFIINASGDLTTFGKQPDGKDWQVGITNPLNQNKYFAWFPIKNKAVVTSGNYEKFLIIDNQRYAHIINPKTGLPTKGILSVTIFAPKAELADALATSVFVQGINVGLDFVNQLKNIECIIVDENGEIHYSDHILKEKL